MSEYFNQQRKELAEFIPNNASKVLEIGCGAGNFRQSFPESTEYWGIEPNHEAFSQAQKKLHKVFNSIFDNIKNDLPKDYFDLIVCNDVIEHMPDHDDFLNSITEFMSKDSHILISIPNVRYLTNLYELLIKKDWQYRSLGILDVTHLRFFTEKSIKNTLKNHNFEIIKFSGINKPDEIHKKAIVSLASAILGKDVSYPQFAILAKKVI